MCWTKTQCRCTPTLNAISGIGRFERRLLAHDWKTRVLAEPPVGSGLKSILGDSGVLVLGHIIDVFRGGIDYALFLY